MRLFPWNLKIRSFVVPAPKPVAETPALSAAAREASHYEALQEAALLRERRAITPREIP